MPKTTIAPILLSITTFLITTLGSRAQRPIAEYIHQAPFHMDIPATPQIPDHNFSITDYGAIGDGHTLNTQAFEKTLAACDAAGGGKITIPAGTWLTGPIRLRSHTELHLDKNAIIQFSDDITQYARPNGSNPEPGNGNNYLPPLNGDHLEDIALTGEGIIDGAGQAWRPIKKEKMTPDQWSALLAKGGVLDPEQKIWWPSREARDANRPVLLQLNRCTRILLHDITLRNSPKFVFYPGHSSELTLDHIDVFNEWWAQNGDGIDISACRNVVIYRSTVSAGDDAICMKSSGGTQSQSQSPSQQSPSLSNILIAACTVYRGHGGFVIGSNTDGGIRNIYVSDCSFIGTDVGLRFKSNIGRGGLVDSIFIDNIKLSNILREAILFDTHYEDMPAGAAKNTNAPPPSGKIPEFTRFHISHIDCAGAATAIRITGLKDMPVHDITMKDIRISSHRGLIASQAKNIDLYNVKIEVRTGPVMDTDPTASILIRD